MNSYKKDYIKIYKLQDKFLSWWSSQNMPFYLTGGTALGRFYLGHRYSEDLDFFVNDNMLYKSYINELKKKITTIFSVNIQQSLFTDDFTRFFIFEKDVILKVEFVNDVSYYIGVPAKSYFGIIDTPANILCNKLTALVGRDEPKDIFDIIHLSLNFSFNWLTIFEHAKQKAVINELDVEQRLVTFPLEWLENVNWLNFPVDFKTTKNNLNQIAEDFLWGKPNSLGIGHPPIEFANPQLFG